MIHRKDGSSHHPHWSLSERSPVTSAAEALRRSSSLSLVLVLVPRASPRERVRSLCHARPRSSGTGTPLSATRRRTRTWTRTRTTCRARSTEDGRRTTDAQRRRKPNHEHAPAPPRSHRSVDSRVDDSPRNSRKLPAAVRMSETWSRCIGGAPEVVDGRRAKPTQGSPELHVSYRPKAHPRQ